MDAYQLIGMMSGTSLDGIDVCHVEFQYDNKWTFELKSFKTYNYPNELVELLANPFVLNGLQVFQIESDLTNIYAKVIQEFIDEFKIDKTKILAIANHGQTIFHQPDKSFSTQLGNGELLARLVQLKVIDNFRNKDVAYGGQGAPLVPKGDIELFENVAESFLNIGGFSNITFKKKDKIIAFDICPGNLPLNKLAITKNKKYDDKGEIASSGDLNFFLLDLLNEIPYYKKSFPKSLGIEWLESEFYPLIKFDRDIESNMRTIVEHIAVQISNVLNNQELKSVLITGGGALNNFLVERIKHYYSGNVVIPNKELIEAKEAIIFAFLGLLRILEIPNCISSVTGAKKNVVGGVIHLP